MRGLCGAIALFVGAWILACSSPEERAERARADAREALARGDREAALGALNVLRELQAKTSSDPLELAQLLVQAGEAPQAVWVLEEAVREAPQPDQLRIALAQASLLVGDAAGARDALAPITEQSEKHAEALVLRSQAELRLGDFDRAMATLEEAERLYPDRAEPRLIRIGTLLQTHRVDEARRALDEARKTGAAPVEDDALRPYAIALHAAEAEGGNFDAAIAGLRALIAQQPEDLRAWQAFAQVMTQAGRVEEATKELRSAVEHDAKNTELLPILAALHRAANHPEEARRVLRELVDRSPSPSTYLALAQHHSAQSDDAGMIDVFDEALRKFPDDPLIQRTRAEALLSAGKVDPARAAIGAYAARFPGDPNTEYLRARLELSDGNAAAAAQRLERLVPRLDRAWTQHWLGRALETAGDRAGADRRYQLALLRDARDPALYGPPIALAERRGDWRRSTGLARQLVGVAPGVYTGWAALTGGLAQQGSTAEAVNAARHAVAIFRDRADAKLLLVRALRSNGEYDAALSALNELGGGAERSPEAAAERVLTLGMAGRVEEGLASANAAVAEHPDSAAVYTARAALLFAAGRAEEGAEAVDRALALDRDDPQPLAIRGRFRAATGRLEGARSDLELYLQRRPEDAQAHFMLGAVHEQSGQLDRAIESYRRAAELDSTAFEPRNNLALLLADRDLDGALAAAQEAYAIRSDNPAVLDTLGWLYLRKGLVDRATSLLEQAHAGAPELAEVQLHLALAHRQAGRKEDARRLLAALAKRTDASPELGARIDEALRSLQ